MKKVLLVLLSALLFLLPSCANARKIPESFADAAAVSAFLQEGNALYLEAKQNGGDISPAKRSDTAENGQKPYATVITCSDSRVPAEHIFSAGVGELFVIRTAGNVIDDYGLGSVEYGAEHLHTKLILVLGHTGCGAVDAALKGGAHGHIADITDEISDCLPAGCTDAREAERLNVKNSIACIMESHIMQELVASGAAVVRGAIYDIETGRVEFMD